MKNLNFTILFFVVFSWFVLSFCTSKVESKFSNNNVLDSISLFIQEMRNKDLDFIFRINHANRALQKIRNKKSDTRIEQILAYKIYYLASKNF